MNIFIVFVFYSADNGIMKNFLMLLIFIGLNFNAFADDQEVEHTHENDYEEGCDNDLDDDLDGDIDEDDSDCDVAAVILGDASESELSSYLVWGIGIALLSSVDGSSGTGTATTD